MKRISVAALFSILALSAFVSISNAQLRQASHAAPAPTQKIAIPCPVPLNDITDCPDTGCGPSLDPHLNRQKNIQSDDQEPVTKTIRDLKNLLDPVPGYKIGDTREKLTALGEGDKITVVAFALVARRGVKESCNCGLTAAADTDNHIVLVSPLLRKKSGETAKELLHRRELASITAEFAPRPRLDHANLTRSNLQPLVTASGGALKVRVTGLLMFDSQHSLEGHLKRHNNWEIHPVLAMEFCPKGKKCTADSDDNWKDLGEQP